MVDQFIDASEIFLSTQGGGVSGQIISTNNNCALRHKFSDVDCSFGIGTGGSNHGVYSNTMNKWMIRSNADGESVWINNMLYGENQILWSGAFYMSDTQTVTLSKKISEMPHGIVLCWSAYDIDNSKPKDNDFNYTFVPKFHVEIFSGKGIECLLSVGVTKNLLINKYVYVSDQSIKGHASNLITNKSVQGTTVNSREMVLRYVIGV